MTPGTAAREAVEAVDLTGGDPGTIHFATKYRRSEVFVCRVPIGFEQIPRADEVYGLFRQVQDREAGA